MSFVRFRPKVLLLVFLFHYFMKKRPQHRCFPVNIVKFVITPVMKNICQRLLLITGIIETQTLKVIFLLFHANGLKSTVATSEK